MVALNFHRFNKIKNHDLLHGPVSRLWLDIRHANLCRTLARKTENKTIFMETHIWCVVEPCWAEKEKTDEKKISKSNAIYVFFLSGFWFIHRLFHIFHIMFCHFLSRLSNETRIFHAHCHVDGFFRFSIFLSDKSDMFFFPLSLSLVRMWLSVLWVWF